MSGKEERNKYVWSELTESTHRTLCRWATKKGKHPSILIADAIGEWITRQAKEEKDPTPEMIVFAALQDHNTEEHILSMLAVLAYNAIQDGDQDKYDRLEEACKAVNVPVEKVMNRTRDTHGKPIIIYDDGHGVSSAMSWLQTTLPNDNEYPSTVMFTRGQRAGFSKSILKEAKLKLGVVSIRRSNNWVWSWPQRVEEEEKEESLI